MSREVEFASPYQWEDDDEKNIISRPDPRLKGEPYIGSGFAALQQQLLKPRNLDMDDSAKQILTNLLMEHDVKLGDTVELSERQKPYEGFVRPLKRSKLPAAVKLHKDILELARDGKVSVFCSLLNAVESSTQPVPTKTLIRKCCLTIDASDLPGYVDAKDYTLAALHFLSSRFESSLEERYPSLPLIYPIQLTGDVEKRNYEKVGDWKLEEIQDKVLRLEQIFISSPHCWKWLRRESFAPRLSKEEDNEFFFKGVIPARATMKKPETGRKRKSAGTATSPAASTASPAPPEGTGTDKQENNTTEE